MNNINNNNAGKLGIIGGDTCQLVAAADLAALGWECAVYGFGAYEGPLMPSSYIEAKGTAGGVTRCATLEGAVRSCDAVILPIPVSTDGIHLNCPYISPEEGGAVGVNEVFSLMRPGQLALGGRCDDKLSSTAALFHVRVADYYDSEELRIANALPTDEGALAIAMRELPITIRGCRALICGYGRVGRTLCELMTAVGAHVTVAARSGEALSWAGLRGADTVKLSDMPSALGGYDVIFNTIPEVIFTRPILAALPKNALIIDLASKPGGVDVRASGELGVNVIWALSLPGKVAPVTAGNIITESIRRLIGTPGNAGALALNAGGGAEENENE